MRLTLDEVRKFISGKQRKPRVVRQLVVPTVETDFLGTRMQVDLPILIVSVPNVREVWQVANKRKQQQQQVVAYWTHAFKHVRNPEAIGLVRIAPGKLDGDNLAASFKAVRDAIARIYQRDDADWKAGALAWTYSQMSMGRLYGVRIAVVGSLI